MASQTSLIEKNLKALLPRKWSKKVFSYFAGPPAYKPDLEALSLGLSEPLADFVFRGGKRSRPQLFFATLDALGVEKNSFSDIAAAVEVIHNGTLVLDDIEDNALLRRGKEACHITYGVDTAVNLGATMHFLPLRFILDSKNNLPNNTKIRLFEIYTDEIIRVSLGQAIDIRWHRIHPIDIKAEQYMEMCRLKTGALMRMSVRMACAVANTSKEIEEIFSKFAEAIGIAFQIRDDCLDLATPLDKSGGDFGKSFGNDISEGKMSLPVILALGALSKEEGKRLIDILNLKTNDPDKIREAIELVKKNQSPDKAMKKAQKLVQEAWEPIRESMQKNFPNGSLDSLRELTNNFITRVH